MVSAPCRRIAIKMYGRQTILSAPEQPHERLALCTACRFMEYLNPGLISHCKSALQQLTVKIIINQLEIVLRTVNNLISQGRDGGRLPGI